MGLTWDEFKLSVLVLYNLALPIGDFINEETEIGETNRRVSEAAKNYLEFFNYLKYMVFMNEVRISFKTVCSSRKILKYENGRIKNC